MPNPQQADQLQKTYQSLLRRPVPPEDEKQLSKQIANDVRRTYPELGIFQKGGTEAELLHRILCAFTVKEPELGYVQGMNFVVASLLYHLQDESLTFWVFCHLVQWLDLKENYRKGLPGVDYHTKQFEKQLIRYFPDYCARFEESGIPHQMYLIEWFIPLACYHLPIQETGDFFRLLLEFGWPFMYCLILQFLHLISPNLQDEDQMTNVQTIKMYNQHGTKNELKGTQLVQIDWRTAIFAAKRLVLEPNSLEIHYGNN